MGNSNKSLINLIVGIALVVIGIAWYVIDIPILSSYLDNPITFSPFWKILAIFAIGLFGICVFFVGLILAWMGWDDYKMEKEMSASKEPEEEVEEEAEEEEIEEEVEEEAEEEETEEEVEEEAEEEETEEEVEEEAEEEETEEEAEEEAKEEKNEEEISAKEAELEKELRAEMEKEKTKPEFVCDICGKAVKSKAGLAAHKRVHK